MPFHAEASPQDHAVPMMSAYLPMMKSWAMSSAAELGVFHALDRADGEGKNAEELAKELQTSAQGMQFLLDLLTSYELVDKSDPCRYRNSPFIRENFTPSARVDFTAGLLWNAKAQELMTELTSAIRRGAPQQTLWQRMEHEPELGRLFSDYMAAFSRYFSPHLVEQVAISPHAQTLLDIGGSHGLNAITLCQQHPQLRATIFDFAASLQGTPALIAQHHMQDRITCQAGNAVNDPLGQGASYDVVLLLSVLHNQSTHDAELLVAKAAQALRPGGTLVVHDHFHDSHAPSLFGAAFNLTLLVEVGTQTPDPAQLHRWFISNDCELQRRIDLRAPGMGSLVIAVKNDTKTTTSAP